MNWRRVNSNAMHLSVRKLIYNNYSCFVFLFLFLFILIVPLKAWVAQGNLKLHSQNAVDQLRPGLTEIKSKLLISGKDIKDLSTLSSLQSVRDLEIMDNDILSNIDGLAALQEPVLHLRIKNNSKLQNIDALSKLHTIDLLNIERNPLLTNLDGLKSLRNIKTFTISSNHSLVNTDGLLGLECVNNFLRITENPNLIDIDGLSSLVSVGTISIDTNSMLQNINGLSNLQNAEDIKISWNNSLTNIDALTLISSIKGYLSIIYNNSLLDLEGLCNLESVSRLWIQGNQSLKRIDGLRKLKYVENISIECTSLTNVDGLKSLKNVYGIHLYNNPNLQNISGLSGLQMINMLRLEKLPLLTDLNCLSSLGYIVNLFIRQNESLECFCGLYESAINKSPSYWEISDNFTNPSRVEIIKNGACKSLMGNIYCTTWSDSNENGQVDKGEKTILDVVVCLTLKDKVSKHTTNETGQCIFKNLREGSYNIIIDETSLPTGVTCTTDNANITVDVNQDNSNISFAFGFANVPDEYLGDEIIPSQEPTSDDVTSEALVAVQGSPIYQGKGGLDWSNAVDDDREGWDGTTLAGVDEAQNTVPFGIFEFGDGGMYKFNYLTYQTDNGTADDGNKYDNQCQKLEVLVSTTGTDADDFTSLGVFDPKNNTDKLRWHSLGDYVTAKYIKIRMVAPTAQYVGGYLQIVEFAVSCDKVSGPMPANESSELALIPDTNDLLANYPNPFNPTTNIVYQVKEDSHVSVRIFDIRGTEVTDLVNGQQDAGQYHITWDASEMPSGVYFLALQAGAEKVTKRILLMK